jgi:mediator of RNA polymerase II transcription subunit 17, fungi type
MTESLRLPLRLPASKGAGQDSLQSRIMQIFSQKGDFRNITEASLLEDINSLKQQDEDTKMAESEESEADERENRYEMIIKAREEMMQQLRWVR